MFVPENPYVVVMGKVFLAFAEPLISLIQDGIRCSCGNQFRHGNRELETERLDRR